MKGLTQYLTEHQKTFSQSQKNQILEQINDWIRSEFRRMLEEWEDSDEMEETFDTYEDWFFNLEEGDDQFEDLFDTVCEETHIKMTYEEFYIILNELSEQISEAINNLCDEFREKWEDNYE